MPWSTPSSGRNKLLFLSFIVLAIVMVLAVAFALRGFNREMATNTDGSSAPTGAETLSTVKNAPMPENLDTLQSKSIPGFISEVISKADSSEKWIVLSVELPKSVPTAMPSSKTAAKTSIPVETVTKSYRFYLGAEVKGAGDIRGGEQVVISFFGDPSETEYVGADGVTVREK